jgi:hypothetical protein
MSSKLIQKSWNALHISFKVCDIFAETRGTLVCSAKKHIFARAVASCNIDATLLSSVFCWVCSQGPIAHCREFAQPTSHNSQLCLHWLMPDISSQLIGSSTSVFHGSGLSIKLLLAFSSTVIPSLQSELESQLCYKQQSVTVCPCVRYRWKDIINLGLREIK